MADKIGTPIEGSRLPRTGTDRIALAATKLPYADAYVNVQGDEPLITPEDIYDFIYARQITHTYEGFMRV